MAGYAEQAGMAAYQLFLCNPTIIHSCCHAK